MTSSEAVLEDGELRPRWGWALASVLVLAALLRAFRLDSGLWYDEVVTLVEFVRLPARELVTTYTSPNNHILYSLAARACVVLFGEVPWALRLPAVAFGVLSVAGLYMLGRRVGERGEALLAALLLAVSYHHVWFSQNARGYTGLLLFALVGTACFLDGMRSRARRPWVAYAVVVAAALYVHLSAVFVFATHGLVWLAVLAWPRARGALPGSRGAGPVLGFALGVGLALALYSPLVPQMFATFGGVAQAASTGEGTHVAQWRSPLWTALEAARGLQLGLASWIGVAAAGALATIGFARFVRQDPLFVAVTCLPFPVTLLILKAISFHIWPRYFFVLAGFALLFLVRGAFAAGASLAAAVGRPARGPAAGAALAGVLIAASALSLPANYRVPKQDYEGARAFVEGARASGDAVATAGLVAYPYETYYATGWNEVTSAAELRRLFDGAPAVWLVYSFPTYMDSAHADVLELARSDFELVREFPGTLSGGTIYVLRSRGRDSAASEPSGS